MKLLMSLFLAKIALGMPVGPSPQDNTGSSTQATLYFMLNANSGNSIVSVNIDTQNTSMYGTPETISTGGWGAYGIGSNGKSVGADVLFSQGSVTVGNNQFLFNVNSGSNTLTMFTIDQSNPQSLTMVGSPQNTLGDFPASVDYSSTLGLACVANSGATNGIMCFNVDPVNGLSHNTSMMVENNFVQQTPPIGPGVTYSRVAWSPDSSYLTAISKGDNYVWGNLTVIPFNQNTGKFETPVISTLTYLDYPFGHVFLSDDEFFVVDPGYGGNIYSINSEYQPVLKQSTNATTDILTCWAAWSPTLQKLYAMDAAQNVIYQFNADGTMSANFTNGGPSSPPGDFDSTITDDGYLFALTGEPGIASIYLPSLEPQAWYNASESVSSNRQYYEGMAKFPNNDQPNFPDNYKKTKSS